MLGPRMAGQVRGPGRPRPSAGCGWSTGRRDGGPARPGPGAGPGSASEPGELTGYGTRATGHLQVAAAIAAGLADAGVASEPAALAYGLAFVPFAAEHFDLVIPGGQLGSREVAAC